MITFSIAVVLLCALAAALILQRASGAARQTGADPTLAVYRRQLSEIDDLADRGLLAEAELKTARAEAARRLLGAARSAETAGSEAGPPRVSRAMRMTVLAGAVAAPVLAGGLYLAFGKPGLPDQPFAARLKAWQQGDPSQLGPGEVAAVLQTIAKARPTDAEPLTYLAKAQAATGNVAAAAETMRKAIRLEPKDPDLWANLGILRLQQGQGEETAPAQDAFRQALALDPRNGAARYHLARARIAAGDVNGGLDQWRALVADLPPTAPEHQQLQDEIDATAKAGRLVAAPKPEAAPPQQQAQGGSAEALAGALTGQAQGPPAGPASGAPDPRQMVAQLEARMRQDPNNLAGWTRLIRSYAVLGMPDKQKQAQDQAREIFKGKPEALQAIDNAAQAPQGSE
ncbi:MAG: c-type cytochrome biogenesis protein CcmI [Caulobacteraceae bacterium]